MKLLLINLVVVNLNWFICVFDGAHGYGWKGLGVVLVWSAIHLWLIRSPSFPEAAFIAAAGCLGWGLDSLLTTTGALGFPAIAGSPAASPAFMVALWMNFATSFPVTLRWLEGRYSLAIALGALSGPVAYYSGVRLGALSLPSGTLQGLALVALAWAVAMPTLLLLRQILIPADADATPATAPPTATATSPAAATKPEGRTP